MEHLGGHEQRGDGHGNDDDEDDGAEEEDPGLVMRGRSISPGTKSPA